MDSEKVLRTILEKRTNLKNIDINQPIASLGLDSLDLVEVMLEIEENLGITFTSDEMIDLTTLKQIKELIDSKLTNK